MAAFITDDFLLHSAAARELYHTHAANQPIFDYHCHLSPQRIVEDHTFQNLTDAWLSGDHYKWRAMRSNGIAEEYCTGSAADFDKFEAFARTVPYTLRNPLYHWSHLELKRYFGIDVLLNENTAREVWETANERLPSLSTHAILERNRVSAVCTTDDPTDTLEHHRAAALAPLKTKLYPTFRPDRALTVDQPVVFNAWTDRLSDVSGLDCARFSGFLDALKLRHDFFHDAGCRLSDHGLAQALGDDCSELEAKAIFDRARAGRTASPEEASLFGSFLMLFFGRLDAARDWTQQLHIGAMRDANTRQFDRLGPDTGFDSIGDYPQGRGLARFLDKLDATGELPRTIIYNLNPSDNYLIGTMIGNFQDGSEPGRIQFGSGWWFLDQKEAMEWQLNALSNLGLLRRFVGMLTDSRSFLSFPRHEYFRRVLCNLIGHDVENGELPRDMELLGAMVREISYENARRFFDLETPEW